MSRPAVSETETTEVFGPHPSRSAGPRLDPGVVPDKARQDPLLLLRPAVRDPALGEGQPGHRLRALARLPLQPGQALPEGRQALPAGRASRPPASRLRARRRARAGGFRPLPYEQAIARVAGEIDRIQKEHGPQAFGVLSGASLTDREGLPDGQVRPRLPEDPLHRLQRPALHGERGRRRTRRRSASTARPTPGATS